VLAGPSASLALADLGAEVLKVEPPGTGDETRLFPPFRDEVSHYFLSVNRGKKSIVVDLKTEAGVALVKDLAAIWPNWRSSREKTQSRKVPSIRIWFLTGSFRQRGLASFEAKYPRYSNTVNAPAG
jgi:CoA-transferase family III